MAEQIPGNLTETSVAVGGYVSGSGLLNVASTAPPFPASGTFSVVVTDQSVSPPTFRGVLRVSAVNSGTQWAVAAEDSDFNANAGDKVYAVESKAALTALLNAAVAAGASAGAAIALAGSYTNVEGEGVPVTQRNTLNFAGAGVVVTDAGGKTLVTIPGGGSGGALVLLEQHAASASATLDFTASISASYDDYLVEFINIIPATNSVDFRMRVSTNGGSSYDTGANYGSAVVWWNSGGTSQAFAISQTTIRLSGDTISSDATITGVTGSIRLVAPGDSTRQKAVCCGQFSNVYDVGGGAARELVQAGGGYQPTTAYDAFRFYFSSGNIASGTIRVYGIAKT